MFCVSVGVEFKKALFVPMSHTVGINALLEKNDDSSVDLSWQYKLQEVWESLVGEEEEEEDGGEKSEVISSLPLAIKWLRDIVVDQNSSSTRFQVTPNPFSTLNISNKNNQNHLL